VIGPSYEGESERGSRVPVGVDHRSAPVPREPGMNVQCAEEGPVCAV
jgi:hypothetical protein